MSFAHPEQGRRDTLAAARERVEQLARVLGAEGEGVIRCIQDALDRPEASFPRLSEAAIQAAQVVESPRCDVLDLADTLNTEPALAVRVVEIANSAFFAGSEPIYTARDAIVRMGIRESRNVVMGLVLRSIVCEGPGDAEHRLGLWHHSLAAAACAQGLLCELDFEDGVGFLAGLSHDVGRGALLAWVGARGEAPAPAVLERVAEELHPALGAAILTHWRQRHDLVDAVAGHHDPLDVLLEAHPMAAALRVADWMAHRLLGAPGTDESEDEIRRGLRALGLTRERTEELESQSRARLDELLKIL